MSIIILKTVNMNNKQQWLRYTRQWGNGVVAACRLLRCFCFAAKQNNMCLRLIICFHTTLIMVKFSAFRSNLQIHPAKFRHSPMLHIRTDPLRLLPSVQSQMFDFHLGVLLQSVLQQTRKCNGTMSPHGAFHGHSQVLVLQQAGFQDLLYIPEKFLIARQHHQLLLQTFVCAIQRLFLRVAPAARTRSQIGHPLRQIDAEIRFFSMSIEDSVGSDRAPPSLHCQSLDRSGVNAARTKSGLRSHVQGFLLLLQHSLVPASLHFLLDLYASLPTWHLRHPPRHRRRCFPNMKDPEHQAKIASATGTIGQISAAPASEPAPSH